MTDITEVNCETGEVIERAFTPKEKTQRQKDEQDATKRGDEEKTKADQRAKDVAELKQRDPTLARILNL